VNQAGTTSCITITECTTFQVAEQESQAKAKKSRERKKERLHGGWSVQIAGTRRLTDALKGEEGGVQREGTVRLKATGGGERGDLSNSGTLLNILKL